MAGPSNRSLSGSTCISCVFHETTDSYPSKAGAQVNETPLRKLSWNANDWKTLAYGFALLGRMPGAQARAALEAAMVRVALDMNAQDVANLFWGFATLIWVGTDGECSPRHRMSFNLRNAGSKCV